MTWLRASVHRRSRWLFTLGAVLACGASTRPPDAPSEALQPSAEARALAEGPFRVVFASPQREAAEAAEVSLVFDRPLIPLSASGREPPKLLLHPEVPGQFRWVGARALVFVPELGRLPFATAVSVEVPGTLRAADGSELGAPYRFEFTTLRPAIVASTPADGATDVRPSDVLTLELNQAIDPGQFERFGTLLAGGKPIAFSARRASPDATKKVTITPHLKLPVDADVRFTLSEMLTGQEGPLPAGKPSSLAFRTYGPLRISSIECNRESVRGNCAPTSAVAVLFTNPVRFGDVKRRLRITPERAFTWPSWYEDSATTTYVEVPAALEAGRRYTLGVAAGLRDVHGQSLAREFQSEIVMDDHFPRVAIGISAGTLLPTERAPIPVVAVNAPGARLRAAALSREDVAELALGSVELAALVRTHPRSHEVVLPRSPLRNEIVRQTLEPTRVLGPAGLGVIGLLADYQPEERDYDVPRRERLAKRSDLGISAKLSRHGSLVWVTRLSTAEAVAGADVELSRADGQRRRYRTKADGIAEIPARDYAPNLEWGSNDRKAVVFASLGEDWNYERLEDASAPWGSEVPMDLSGAERDDGLLFTDRGVYRPGDSVSVKGIVRRQRPQGSVVPSDAKLTLSLRGPNNEALRRVQARLSAWGTFDVTFPLPPASGLGSHLLSATLGRNEITARFEVQEYRPQEFRVDVKTQVSSVQGERASFDVLASYLFGAPVADAELRYIVTRQASDFTPPGTERLVTNAAAFYADLPDTPLSGAPLVDTSATLDAQGSFRLEQALVLPGQRAAENVILEAEVSDVSRSTVAGRAALLVHPAEFYVGIEAPSGFVEKVPSRVLPKVAVLSPGGHHQVGKRVMLELIERRFSAAPPESGETESHGRLRAVDKTLARCELLSGAGLASCPLQVERSGYYLVRARATDRRGNVAEAAVPLYAPGTDSIGFQSDDVHLSLVMDKKMYRVGDRARVLVKSPFAEAEALITVERAGILHRERRLLRGSMPSFEVPITEQQRPNAFVAVHLIRRVAQATGEKAYRFGYTELKIDPEEQRLSVDVVPNRRELGPGQEVEVAVNVKDGSGRGQAAEVTLYAVDEGVLLLTGYQVPDPVPVFTATRPLQVATLETRASLAQVRKRGLDSLLFGSKGEEGGGGGDSSTRRDFQQTAYFNPRLVTDKVGRARVRFRLPEALTRYRVMAVAVGQGERYGFGSNEVTTSKRLMLRPALPRFLRVGDHVEAGVVVSGKRFGPAEVLVVAKAQGLAQEGSPERRITLPAEGSVEVRFSFRALKPGMAQLSFHASSGKERDAVTVERPVFAPALLEASSVSGSTTRAIAERLGDLSGLRPDVGGLELSVAPSALVGLESAVAALAEYPYGCTEQLASRLVALLVQSSLGADAGSRGTAGAASARALVRDVLARQRGDGGFGFWDDARESHPWVSAYALSVLHAAQRRGLEIPDQRLKAGRVYLRRFMASVSGDPLGAATAAYVLDVLATVGEPDIGYMNRLFEARSALPPFARASLLSAMATGKGDAKQVSTLVTELEGLVRVTGLNAVVVENVGDAYAVLMSSEARTQALVLRALLLSRPTHPLLSPLARGLLAARRGGTWSTTQESAFALLSLDLYRRAREVEVPDFQARVLLGERLLFESRFAGRDVESKTRHIPMSELLAQKGASGALVFEREGRGTLFYQARLRYARTELPKAPLDAGFFIEKTLRPIDPGALGSLGGLPPGVAAARFRGGDLVLADLLVVNSSPREYVAIDDPLPAGFEAVNAAFLTTASRYDPSNSAVGSECPSCAPDQRDDIAEGRTLRHSESRRELYDDRVAFLIDHLKPGIHRFRYLARATTFGRFVIPPTRVFGMYEPEISGRTAASVVEVR